MTSIREADLDRDAPGLTEIARETNPTAVVTPASFAHFERSSPPEARSQRWVAEEDGRIVGTAVAFLQTWVADEASSAIHLAVSAAHRRRGLGSALYARAAEHLEAIGARRILTSFHENDAGVLFARARGYVEVRSEQEAELDPRHVAGEPSGDVRPLRAIDPRLAYVIDIEATHDMPASEEFTGMTYDEWARFILEHPLIALDGSFVAFADGEAAAVSLITADPESGRAMSIFTGTRRDFRGRGFAQQAKLASVRWAAAHGITRMLTYNDSTNAAMLAINERLGYRRFGRKVEMLKRGETASSRAPRAPAT